MKRLQAKFADPIAPSDTGLPSSPVSEISVTFGTRTGILIGFRSDGQIPLVSYPGQPGRAALSAQSIVDVHGAHIGRRVVLAFDDADPARPIILGVVRVGAEQPACDLPGNVDIDADGERLIVSAKRQLVLRCGKASIVLTAAGRVIVHGEYLESRASGTHRIRGGSVQIN